MMTGTVVRLHGHHAYVDVDGVEWTCAVRGRMKIGKRTERSPIVVGDRVRFDTVTGTEQREGQIDSVEDRATELYRSHPRHPRQRQVLAANVELLVIVCAADMLGDQLITADRLLISAFSQGLTPVLVVNKAELAAGTLDTLRDTYAKVCDVHVVSALKGELGALPGLFAGKTAVFAGPSGVGKSSLLNAMQPGLNLRVGEVDGEGEGRHTTTHASLLRFAGGFVVDTPGVRDFGFWNVELHEIALYYPDFAPFREQCRFNTCTHRHEPGCGVKAAVEAGTLDAGRFERYGSILRETWNEQERLGW
jgi:ribosome biogenesis GTPase